MEHQDVCSEEAEVYFNFKKKTNSDQKFISRPLAGTTGCRCRTIYTVYTGMTGLPCWPLKPASHQPAAYWAGLSCHLLFSWPDRTFAPPPPVAATKRAMSLGHPWQSGVESSPSYENQVGWFGLSVWQRGMVRFSLFVSWNRLIFLFLLFHLIWNAPSQF